MPYNEVLADRIRAALAAHPNVDEKKMFGGLSFMIGGQMCCGVLKNDLVVRIEPDQFGELTAQAHVRPFDFTGRPTTGMVYVSEPGLGSDAVLRRWVQRGVDWVAAHPAKAKSGRRG